MRLHLGFGCHPFELVDTGVHRRDDVLDQLVRRRLGLGREIFGDVQLADLVIHRSAGELHRALPALFLLRRSAQRRAIEGEILVVERLGQHVGEIGQRLQDQLILQHADRRGGDQLRYRGDRTGLRDDDIGDGVCATGLEHRREIDPRRQLLELCHGHLVIRLGRIAAFDARPADLGDRGFERDDRLGTSGRISLTGQREHLGDMRFVSGFCSSQLRIAAEIIIAVRQAETRLIDAEDIGVGVLVVLPDTTGDRPDNSVAREFAEQRRIGLFGRALDLGQDRLDRGHALGVDRRTIEIGGISDADLRRRILGLFIQNAARARFRQIGQDVERPIVRFIRRDRRVLGPSAAGVIIETVTGLHGPVHTRFVEAKRAISGFGGHRRCRSGRFGRRSGVRRLHRRTAGKRGGGQQQKGERTVHKTRLRIRGCRLCSTSPTRLSIMVTVFTGSRPDGIRTVVPVAPFMGDPQPPAKRGQRIASDRKDDRDDRQPEDRCRERTRPQPVQPIGIVRDGPGNRDPHEDLH